jgi:hypothetical protein
VDNFPAPKIPLTPTFEAWPDFPLHGNIVRVGLNYKLNWLASHCFEELIDIVDIIREQQSN